MIQNNNGIATQRIKRKPSLGLILTILNIAFCLAVIGYFIISGVGVVLFPSHGAESGWFLFIAPVLIAIFLMFFMPDYMGVMFAILHNKTRKKFFLIFLMMCMFTGFILMNSKLGVALTSSPIRLIYSIIKIIIFIYCLIRLIIPEKEIK